MSEVAEVNVAYFLGEASAMAIFPVAGLILLFVGLRQQSRARQLPAANLPPTPYPADPPSYPPGPPTPEFDPNLATPPRAPRWSNALIAVGSLLLIFGLLGIMGNAKHLVWQSSNTPKSPDVGQCIAAYNFREHNKTPQAQDCSKADSIFEVVTKGSPSSTCPDGKTDKSDYAFLRDGSTTLCFILNFVQGRCYTAAGDAQGALFDPTDCDGSGPRFKVASRFDGSSDTASCPAGTKEIAYQSPARLYCLQPLKS